MSTGEGWTIDDAAELLDPIMTAIELRALVAAARIQPIGVRRTGRRGRPSPIYDPAQLMRAHAAMVDVWHAA